MTTKYLGDGIWARRTNLDASDIMMPVDVQSHHQELIQTHNAVSISGNNGTSASSYYNVQGFDKIGVSVSMAGGTGMTVYAEWSMDGVAFFATTTVADSSGNTCNAEIPVTAPFVRITIKNKDASASKTTSAYMFLKA